MAVFPKHHSWLLPGKQTIGGAGQPVQRCVKKRSGSLDEMTAKGLERSKKHMGGLL